MAERSETISLPFAEYKTACRGKAEPRVSDDVVRETGSLLEGFGSFPGN
jgi:hypothetical protein